MRGEFIGVWSETWREIWLPLIDGENVPNDIFCELYRELARALKPLTTNQAVDLAIMDAIQSREAFDQALRLAGIDVQLAQWNQIYDDAIPVAGDVTLRRSALVKAVAKTINTPEKAPEFLSLALASIAADPQKRMEAHNRSLENAFNDKQRSRDMFEHTEAADLAGERALVVFFEAANDILEELRGDSLSNRFFSLLTEFIEKFSLRYDLRRPCVLCPTLPGVFSSLVRDLKTAASRDVHLDGLMKDFEESIRDLRTDCSDSRIRTCMIKQINLLEAMGSRFPGVTAGTVGQICDQVGTWPHVKVKEAMQNLYKFTCNYPGIRHGGTPASALRVIEMRDMVAMSILLAGFMPYLTDQIDSNLVYRGA